MLVKAIEEACLRILENEGPDQLTTQRIADVAGINIASLYQYFPNKEAVLAEVFDEKIRRYTEHARQRILEIDKLSRTSFEDTLRAIIDMEIDQRLLLHQMDPEFYRAYQHSFDMHRRVQELTVSMDNPSWEQWFPEFLGHHRHRVRTDDVEILSSVATRALLGTLISIMAEEPQRLEEPAIREELYQLLYRYLVK